MATRLGIRELRDNLPAMMRRVRDGEIIEVTHHGVPIAVISPVVQDDIIAQLVARGEVTLPIPLEEPIEPMPVTGPMTASEALQEERDSYEF
jgi:prevent-host-death family protein